MSTLDRFLRSQIRQHGQRTIDELLGYWEGTEGPEEREKIQRPTGSYQGWTNYETWNVSLWIHNDEGLYRSMMRTGPFTDESARIFVEQVMPEGTPDFRDMGGPNAYRRVDWAAIAEAFNENFEEEEEEL